MIKQYSKENKFHFFANKLLGVWKNNNSENRGC